MKRSVHWWVIAVFAVFVVWAAVATAKYTTMQLQTQAPPHHRQDLNVQRFPLNVSVLEPGLNFCTRPEIARRLSDLQIAGQMEAGQRLYAASVVAGYCGEGSFAVTYRRQVSRRDVGGHIYTIYEAEATEGKLKIYVMMRGFLHEGSDS